MIKNKNKVAIIVPIYKNQLNENELVSLSKLDHYLSNYSIYSIGPKNTSRRFPNYKFCELNPKYFNDVASYSKLLLTKEFYKCFANYDFMLIYQIDCLVFSSDLDHWCDLGYDYIGAPWFRVKKNAKSGFSRVGNGGLSLRKIKSFLNVLNSKKPKSWLSFLNESFPDKKFWDLKSKFQVYREVKYGIDWYIQNYSLNEDIFWSDRARLFDSKFKIAPIEIGLKFAFEAHPEYCFIKNNYQLPFGAHAWEMWGKSFWKDYL